jgi:Mg2+ and Co2+ transporter CorA
MNFEHIPLHSNPNGFTILVSAQVMVALLILAGLKWRKLL